MTIMALPTITRPTFHLCRPRQRTEQKERMAASLVKGPQPHPGIYTAQAGCVPGPVVCGWSIHAPQACQQETQFEYTITAGHCQQSPSPRLII